MPSANWRRMTDGSGQLEAAVIGEQQLQAAAGDVICIYKDYLYRLWSSIHYSFNPYPPGSPFRRWGDTRYQGYHHAAARRRSTPGCKGKQLGPSGQKPVEVTRPP